MIDPKTFCQILVHVHVLPSHSPKLHGGNNNESLLDIENKLINTTKLKITRVNILNLEMCISQ